MQWLNELPFADNRVLQIGFLAACGIAALIVLAIVYRLTFAHRLRVPGGRTRQPRLGLVDAFSPSDPEIASRNAVTRRLFAAAGMVARAPAMAAIW